jgi:YegS/Rv2252/BmrU family lipid kinase
MDPGARTGAHAKVSRCYRGLRSASTKGLLFERGRSLDPGRVSESLSFVLVVNPRAGAGRAERRLPALERALRMRKLDYRVVLTSSPGDATRLVREALGSGAEGIAVVGGDGTLNEATNGFFTEKGELIATKAWLGPLSCGTGGDFRKTLASTNAGSSDAAMEALVERLIASPVRAIDAGWLSFVGNDGAPAGRAFLNIASFGLGGLVDRLVNDAPKWMGGTPAFFVGALRAASRYQNQRVRVTVDDELPRETSIANLAIANGRFFGGGMQIAPRAELDDGLFDIVGLENVGFADQLQLAPHLYAGTLLGKRGVTYTRGRVVVAEPVDPRDHVLLDVDGEAPGRLPARFELRPGALRLRG